MKKALSKLNVLTLKLILSKSLMASPDFKIVKTLPPVLFEEISSLKLIEISQEVEPLSYISFRRPAIVATPKPAPGDK
jgi:hypothetical protein